MSVNEKLGIPTEDEIKNAGKRERKILQRIQRIWNDNDIEEIKSWIEEMRLGENNSQLRTIEIYEVNGERRYYDFIATEFGRTIGRRYIPRKFGEAWIHDTVEGEKDDIDRLLLREYHNKLDKIQRAVMRKQGKERRIKLAKIDAAFRGAEIPDPKTEVPDEAEKYREGFEKMRVSGVEYDHPDRPKNEFGGGEYWVLQEDKGKIWRVINNGGDNDDWCLNNVKTGGAGGIGSRIDWDDKTANLIKKYGIKKEVGK